MNVKRFLIYEIFGLSLTIRQHAPYNTADFAITPAPTTTTASNASAIYNDADQNVTLSATVVGSIVNEGTVTFTVKKGSTTIGIPTTSGTVSGGNASATYVLPGGTDIGTYNIEAVYNPGTNFYGSSDYTKILTVGVASTSISVAASSVQYSDQVTLVATIISPTAQTELNATGGTVVFKIQLGGGSIINLGSSSASSSVISGTFTIIQAPGIYKVIVEFTPNSSNLNGCSNNNTGPLTITQENALAEYTGTNYFSTSSATSTKANVTLSATVFDVNDDFRGDIRNAKVTFRRDSPTGTILGSSSLNVGLVNENDKTVGTATTTFEYVLNTTDQKNGGYSFDVFVVVNNYYTGISLPEVITISIPGQDNVTGGGFVVTNNSQGIYRGKVGAKTNFGFTMKYNKSGKNIQGQANIIVRAHNDSLYQIKSNAINSMAINGKYANFETKANMKNITDPDPLKHYSLPGNFILTIAMFDSSAQGQSDSVSITYQNEAGGLLFSSNWNGTRSILQGMRKPFGGGNIRVASASLAKESEINVVPTEYALYQNYPNPFNPNTTIQFDLPENSLVSIIVYDILGREVATLINGEVEAGRFQHSLDGSQMSSGVYFIKINATSLISERKLTDVKKMILMK